MAADGTPGAPGSDFENWENDDDGKQNIGFVTHFVFWIMRAATTQDVSNQRVVAQIAMNHVGELMIRRAARDNWEKMVLFPIVQNALDGA